MTTPPSYPEPLTDEPRAEPLTKEERDEASWLVARLLAHDTFYERALAELAELRRVNAGLVAQAEALKPALRFALGMYEIWQKDDTLADADRYQAKHLPGLAPAVAALRAAQEPT